MKSFARLAYLAGLLLLAGPADADQGTYPRTEEEKQAAFEALNWRDEPKAYSLDASHAQVRLPPGNILLLGGDAERYSWLVSGVEFPGTEAVMSHESGESDVYYEWRDEGYVDDSDWSEVDGDDLLAQYKESTEQSNEERIANGFEPMEVVGWLQPPAYDEATRTVTYALELKDSDEHWANVVALRLGRGGYAEMTWVGSIGAMQNSGGRPALLQTALDIHAFDEGHRYADFQEGDKVASYGIAGLVATALGLKFGKGIIAAIIAFLIAGKKIVIPVILVAGVAILKFGRGLFGRNRADS